MSGVNGERGLRVVAEGRGVYTVGLLSPMSRRRVDSEGEETMLRESMPQQMVWVDARGGRGEGEVL